MANWRVTLSKRAAKQAAQLTEDIRDRLVALLREIEVTGPVQGAWRNYSPLGKGKHHCHIRHGKPTYVACWLVVDKKVKHVEVYYVGTHEKAPY